MKHILLIALLASTAMVANAQFTGPSATGRNISVAQANSARVGSYVTVTGNIVNHQRGNFFTFRDTTGEIRVEIDSATWQSRPVTPDTKVRLLAEVDRGIAGRYLWVKSIEILP